MGVGCISALDEKMSKLSARESAALYTRKLFRGTNYTVLATSTASIITLLSLKLSPTRWGWMSLVIDMLTVISGIAGFVSSTESGCYTFQVVMTAITAVLQGCQALVLFTQTTLCLNHLRPSTTSNPNDYGGKALFQFDAVLSLIRITPFLRQTSVVNSVGSPNRHRKGNSSLYTSVAWFLK